MKTSVCCKCRPIFFCIRRKKTESGVSEIAQAYCDSHKPRNLQGENNIEEISREDWFDFAHKEYDLKYKEKENVI